MMKSAIGILMAGILIILFISQLQLSVSGDDVTECTWRYSSLFSGLDVFSSRHQLQLEYLGTKTNIYWHVPFECDLTTNSSLVTLLHCRDPGNHVVSLSFDDVNGDRRCARNININKRHDCYKWHAAELLQVTGDVVRRRDDSDGSKISVWIIDDIDASEAEKNASAVVPSQASKQLTKLFHIMGQIPYVFAYAHNLHYSHDVSTNYIGFDEKKGWWLFHVHVNEVYQWEAVISGQSIAIHDCFVGITTVILPGIKFYNEMFLWDEINNKVKLSCKDTTPYVITDPCAVNVAAILTNDSILLTQDNFISVSQIYVFSYIPGLNNPTLAVDQVVFSSQFLFILVESDVYMIDIHNLILMKPPGLQSGIVSKISGRHWCDMGVDSMDNNKMIAAWSSGRLFLYGCEGAVNFTEIFLPIDQLSAIFGPSSIQIVITSVAFGPYPNTIGVSLKVTDGADKKSIFGHYNWKKGQWMLALFMLDVSSEAVENQDMSLMYLNSGITSYLFWNSNTLFYSYDEDGDVGVMNVYQCNTTALTTGNIRQILVSNDGIIVVLTLEDIFYGRVKLHELLKFEYGLLKGPAPLLFFDILNRLYVIELLGNEVKRVLVPLKNEVHSILSAQSECPFHYFVHNVNKDMYFLDMNERVTLWAVVVYPESVSNHIDLQMTGGDIILYDKNSVKDHEGRMMSETKTITFYQDFNFDNDKSYHEQKLEKSGLVAVELRPNQVHLSCPAPTNTVTYLSIGCPPGRRIKVKMPTDSCDFFYNFTLPLNYTEGYKSSSKQESVIFYDWENFGCPLKVHNLESFSPQLEVYDNDVFIKDVDANFVLWEVNRRTDFLYSGSMEQAGCRKMAQTWESMRASSIETDPTLIWGAHNYDSCFASDTGQYFDLKDRKYNIFNKTSPTKIKFPDDHDGIYVFRVWLLDRNYSFCSLESVFAVQSYGAVPLRDTIPLLISVCAVVSVVVFSLGWTYTIYRKQYNNALGLNMEVQTRVCTSMD